MHQRKGRIYNTVIPKHPRWERQKWQYTVRRKRTKQTGTPDFAFGSVKDEVPQPIHIYMYTQETSYS